MYEIDEDNSYDYVSVGNDERFFYLSVDSYR